MTKKTAVILSFTPITDEPRVLRQVRALKQDGWDIVLCGFVGRKPKPEGVKLLTFVNAVDPVPPREGNDNVVVRGEGEPAGSSLPVTPDVKSKFQAFVRTLKDYIKQRPFLFNIAKWVLRLRHIYPSLKARFSNDAAIAYYWSSYSYSEKYAYIKSELDHIPELKTSDVLVVAHDYFTMPIAEKIANQYSGKFVSDIHEYATGQYMDNWVWRLMLRPWVDRMQRVFLPKSAFNSTVCDGIANLLAEDYEPLERPAVVRSVPSYVQCDFKSTDEKIHVLYHGILWAPRGMQLAMDSLKLWRPEFHLTFRGPCDPAYSEELLNYAKELGVSDRFTLEGPVLFDEIIPTANKADIGYFVHKDISPQKRFALPNKFFEYVAAGLALCISDLPEMARLTRQYDMGKLVGEYSPEAVAETINSFTRDKIDEYKKNSLAAAKELCWENEQSIMLDAYNAVLKEQ